MLYSSSLGRSGSFFVFSPDKNFILKTVERNEQQVLRKITKSFCEVLFLRCFISNSLVSLRAQEFLY